MSILNTQLQEVFAQWVRQNFKATLANQMIQALCVTNDFLIETHVLTRHLLEYDTTKAVQALSRVEGNRLFKNKHGEFLPIIAKLTKAIKAFYSNEEYQQMQKVVLSSLEQPVSQAKKHENEETPEIEIADVSIPDKECGKEQHVIEEKVVESSAFEKTVDSDTENSTAILTTEHPISNILSKCIIKLDGMTISKEYILDAFYHYLDNTITPSKHTAGIVLHTGSITFDALAVFYAALLSIYQNENDPEVVVNSLVKGDLVIYRTSGYRFDCIEEYQGLIRAKLIEDKTTNTTWVPKSQWKSIIPYYGKASLSKHIRTHNKTVKTSVFFENVLGLSSEKYSGLVNQSTVIVMNRERANHIINGITIVYNNCEFKLLDIVTASYYTDNEEYPYSGNIGKNEPVLKIASKVSVGRRQLLKRGQNQNIGIMVFGDDIVERSITEIPEILNRKSAKFISIFMSTNSQSVEQLLEDNEAATLFACTKDCLLSIPLQQVYENYYTNELHAQIDTVLEHSISPEVIEGPFTWQQSIEFRKNISIMRSSDFDSAEKEDFIMLAWSLMNLYTTAIFPIDEMDKLINRNVLALTTIEERLSLLREKRKRFTEDILRASSEIISFLENIYLTMLDSNPKWNLLLQVLCSEKDRSICIVVPKAFYATVLQHVLPIYATEMSSKITVVTANRFDKTKVEDLVIVAGDISGKNFDIFRCDSAMEVKPLLYSFENNHYTLMKKAFSRRYALLQKRSSVEYDIEEDDEETIDNNLEKEVTNSEQFATELDEYVARIMERNVFGQYTQAQSRETVEADVSVVVSFESGERAFLTPNYKASIIRAVDGNAVEVKVDDLCEGDCIIFTRNDDSTHNIVDDTMDALIAGGFMTNDEVIMYRTSKLWKKELIGYMERSGKKPKQIAVEMKQNGVSVTEQTVLRWLDPYAHTVGPRNLESYRQIGFLTENVALLDHPEIVLAACKCITQKRVSILQSIGKAVIAKISGKARTEDNPVLSSIYDRIDEQADIMKIDSILHVVDKKMPVNYTNRPLSM